MNQTIALNMIVKNEESIIENTLNNLLKYIHFDYWVICDTGSTDNTKEVIIDFFNKKNIPGELICNEWRDFGYNRTLALENVYNKTDYLLIFDADDSIEGNLKLPKELTQDKYMLKFSNNITYLRPLLINNRKKWSFKGVLHEYLNDLEKNITTCIIEGDYYINSGKFGNRSTDPNKYLKDANILKEAFINETDVHLKNRYAFYFNGFAL
jgi:glycosyltransferase involved in cell wall biosynthesis